MTNIASLILILYAFFLLLPLPVLSSGAGYQGGGGAGGTTLPGGTSGQIQYNNGGAFGGTSNITLPQLPTGMTGQMQCRLYLTSGSPYTDATNATNTYVGPAGGGNNVALPDATGNVYTTLPLSEITTAVPAGYFRIYDVFLHNNSGTVAESQTAWDSGGQVSGTITSVSIANPAVISTSNTTGIAVGDLIGVAGIVGTVGTNSSIGLNSRVFKIASIVANTSITLETGINTASLAYTSSGNWYRIPVARTTGLTYANGQYHQSGALNNIYVGTYMVDGTGLGYAQDNTSSRLNWNYFNRVNKQLIAQDTTSTWTYATGAWRPRDNNIYPGVGRNEFITGITEDAYSGSIQSYTSNATSGNYQYQELAINTVAPGTSTALVAAGFNQQTGFLSAQGNFVPTLGYSFAQALEAPYPATSMTWYGYSNTSLSYNGAGSSFIQGRF